MPKYIAFLRAINVGGHTVKMDLLRTLFEELGLAKVETFIASGNVIFDSGSKNMKALERKIEDHLKTKLGYDVATFVRAASELRDIANYFPFGASDRDREGVALYIGFLADNPTDSAIKKLLILSNSVEEFQVHGREIYWLCRKKFSEPGFSGAQLEKVLGMRATLRNSTTVKKLAAKYS